MKQNTIRIIFLAIITLFCISQASVNAANMRERIEAATRILEDKQGSANPIPQKVLDNARGVAIISVTKAGLVIGGVGGQGIVVVKKSGPLGSSWLAPSAFDMSGGSFGAQIGGERKDYIMVLNTKRAVKLFTSPGKMAWDAQASGTAGEASATEGVSNLDDKPIMVYEASEGMYGGATLGGTTISLNDKVNRQAYGRHIFVKDILDGKVRPPKSTQSLYALLNGKR